NKNRADAWLAGAPVNEYYTSDIKLLAAPVNKRTFDQIFARNRGVIMSGIEDVINVAYKCAKEGLWIYEMQTWLTPLEFLDRFKVSWSGLNYEYKTGDPYQLLAAGMAAIEKI